MRAQRAVRVQMGIRIPRMVTKAAIQNVMQVCLVGIISVQRTVPRNQSVWVVRIKPRIPCIMVLHLRVQRVELVRTVRQVRRLVRRAQDQHNTKMKLAKRPVRPYRLDITSPVTAPKHSVRLIIAMVQGQQI